MHRVDKPLLLHCTVQKLVSTRRGRGWREVRRKKHPWILDAERDGCERVTSGQKRVIAGFEKECRMARGVPRRRDGLNAREDLSFEVKQYNLLLDLHSTFITSHSHLEFCRTVLGNLTKICCGKHGRTREEYHGLSS
jgi:hypothetical protein